MTIQLTGHDLDRAAVVRVARGGEAVTLAPQARARMDRTRAIVREALGRGDSIYGSSTAVGVLKRVAVAPSDAGAYQASMLRHHLVGQGGDAPDDVVRATILRLANHFAEGSPGVRPDLADRLIDALGAGASPRVPEAGSIGQADLAPLAHLAVALTDGFALEPGEGTALLDNNAFATAWATLAVADAETLLDALDVAGAVSLEGFLANPSLLEPAIGVVRPFPGIQRTLARLTALLEDSPIHDEGVARNLQDPLSFRNLPQVHGAARDTLAHLDAILAIELNASQGNPIVLEDPARIRSVANFESLPLAAGLDYLRIVLASVIGMSTERIVKLLGAPWSGLPTGLAPAAGTSHAGLTYLSLAAQSLAVEARLLAQPVSYELVSTSHAEGIEDRTTSAPLGARRLADMVRLGASIAAMELAVGAQAVELRGLRRGRGTGAAIDVVRRDVPFLRMGDHVPDITGLASAVRAGDLARVSETGGDAT